MRLPWGPGRWSPWPRQAPGRTGDLAVGPATRAYMGGTDSGKETGLSSVHLVGRRFHGTACRVGTARVASPLGRRGSGEAVLRFGVRRALMLSQGQASLAACAGRLGRFPVAAGGLAPLWRASLHCLMVYMHFSSARGLCWSLVCCVGGLGAVLSRWASWGWRKVGGLSGGLTGRWPCCTAPCRCSARWLGLTCMVLCGCFGCRGLFGLGAV